MMNTGKGEPRLSVTIPVSRMRAMTRAVLWLVPAFFLAAVAWTLYARLDFHSAGVAGRLVEFAWAAVALPIPVAALIMAILGLRWAGVALWPGRVAVEASESALVLRLGTFGTRRYDPQKLRVRYLFEMDDLPEGTDYEAFLPEETQRERFLPFIQPAHGNERLDRVILRFVGATEEEAAASLRPVLERWRGEEADTDREEQPIA